MVKYIRASFIFLRVEKEGFETNVTFQSFDAEVNIPTVKVLPLQSHFYLPTSGTSTKICKMSFLSTVIYLKVQESLRVFQKYQRNKWKYFLDGMVCILLTIVLLINMAWALVQWLWEETHFLKAVGSNPSTVCWMVIFHIDLL